MYFIAMYDEYGEHFKGWVTRTLRLTTDKMRAARWTSQDDAKRVCYELEAIYPEWHPAIEY